MLSLDFWSAAAMQHAMPKMFSGIMAVLGMTYLAVAKAPATGNAPTAPLVTLQQIIKCLDKK